MVQAEPADGDIMSEADGIKFAITSNVEKSITGFKIDYSNMFNISSLVVTPVY